MYDQITLTSGGTYEPKIGDVVTGNTSGKTAVIVSITDPATGTWAGGDATGTVTYRSASGTFTNSETVSISRANVVSSSNAYTHAASDLVQFEYSDTLTATNKSWGTNWSASSPADDTLAEGKLDVGGADVMIILTSTCTADSKLLIRGY